MLVYPTRIPIWPYTVTISDYNSNKAIYYVTISYYSSDMVYGPSAFFVKCHILCYYIRL